MNLSLNRRILLIDDTSSIHQDFRKILSPKSSASTELDAAKSALFGGVSQPAKAGDGFILDSAFQGKDGWIKVCESVRSSLPYALAFVDMRMPPGWDGVETIARLWQEDPQLQVVICTAYSDYSLEDVLARLDARDRLLILKKPFDSIEVFQMANALTAKWHLNQLAASSMSSLEEKIRERTNALVQANEALLKENRERLAVEGELRLKHKAIESSTNAIFLSNNSESGNPVEYVNPAFEKLTGYQSAEILGRNVDILYGKDTDQPGVQMLRQAVLLGGSGHATLRNFRKDGTPFWSEWDLAPVLDSSNQPSHFVGVVNDITAARQMEEQLQHRADYDALTGLPNRLLLMDRMRQVIANADREKSCAIVAFLDLDRFKFINDSLGHDAGDILLKEIAARLLESVRESDTVARLGGDEFVVVFEGELVEGVLLPVMQRIVERIAEPVRLLGKEHRITCSIGISVFPHDGQDPETLLKNADRAMYQAKDIGRNSFQFFTPEMNARLNQRLKLERDLQEALDRQEFELYYQPQLDLHSGSIVGCEALIRWHHPERGLVYPAEFIPVAEASDLILRIGEWVLSEACFQIRARMIAGLPPLPVAINLSARQFARQDIPHQIQELLQKTGIEPGMLELEITESLSMQDPPKTMAFIESLRAIGVGVAIDDFGTGYSNLSYLKQFPADKLKLDRSFVLNITNNPEDIAISSAIIEMGHSLHLKVVAEGVERESQLSILRAHGCDQMQGFLFSPALPASEFAELLRSGRQLPISREQLRQRERILLLLDDDKRSLAISKLSLASCPYKILTAESVGEAFELLALYHIEVVLSDYRMPEMSGLAFLEKVRRMYPGTVRMVLSGYPDSDILLRAINMGLVYKFLCKPCGKDELVSALDDAFERAARSTID